MGFKAISPFWKFLDGTLLKRSSRWLKNTASLYMFSYHRSTDWGGWEGWRRLRCFLRRYWCRVFILGRREVIASWISTIIYWYVTYCKNLVVFVGLSAVLLMFQPFTVNLTIFYVQGLSPGLWWRLQPKLLFISEEWSK